METSEISPKDFIVLARSLMEAKTEAEVQSKILDAGITLTIISESETKIYNDPQPTPELPPRVEAKTTPVLNALPQSSAESAQQVAALCAQKARVPNGRKRKKKS